MMGSDGNLMERLMQFRVALFECNPSFAEWSLEDVCWRGCTAFPKVKLEKQVVKVTYAGCGEIFLAEKFGKCFKQVMPISDNRLLGLRIHAGLEGKAANSREVPN